MSRSSSQTTSRQMSLFTLEIVIVQRQDLLNAWQWLIQNMSCRPTASSTLCVFDKKLWKTGVTYEPFDKTAQATCYLACLYLTSEIGNDAAIVKLVNEGCATDLVVYSAALDPDVKKVIKNAKRFRNALSEHIAFWSRLATEVQWRPPNATAKFGCSLPNTQPEDKGPDSVFLSTAAHGRVEYQSVKNSVSNPSAMIASPKFRCGGRPKKGKLLDDFRLKTTQNLGLVRLDRQLSALCNALDLDVSQRVRMGL